MILVLLGTQNNNFKRLLEKIEELKQKEIIRRRSNCPSRIHQISIKKNENMGFHFK